MYALGEKVVCQVCLGRHECLIHWESRRWNPRLYFHVAQIPKCGNLALNGSGCFGSRQSRIC